MSIYITKDGQKKKVNISATDVQLLDIDGRFKSKNLEDALKEVGSGTEENMTRIENKVDGVYNKNLFANGDFQVWSNGTTLTNLKGGQVLADKWILSVFGSSTEPQSKMTVSKIDDGMKLVCTQPDGNGNIILQQIISQEELNRLKGKTVTFSFVVKYTNTHNISSSFNVSSLDGFENPKTFTPTGTLVNTSDYVTYSTTFNIPINAKVLMPQFLFSVMQGRDCTIEIKSAKLEVGNKATPFVPKLYSEELLACNDGVISSNPNLLINGDFQVWQRGLGNNGNNHFNCVNANVYTADRFMVCGEQGTSLIAQKQENSGIKLVFQDHTLNTSNIRTWFDRDDILKMVGKTYTYSVEYQYEYNDPWGDGFNIFSYPNNSVRFSFLKSKKIEVGFKQIRLEVTFRIDSVSNDTTKMHIQWLRSRGDVDGFGYHIIRYVKLELGSVATPFVPRPYAEELALCQRYYETGTQRGFAEAQFGQYLSCDMFTVEKRVEPTMTIDSAVDLNGNIIASNMVAHKTTKKMCELVRTSDNSKPFKINTMYKFNWIADAEIY